MEVANKGTIRVVQTSGDSDLYGSKIRHSHWITLEIAASNGGESMDPFDRHSPEFGKSLITVDISLLQFAEMLTSLGKGEGTPCTIRRFNGKGLPKYELPDQKKTLLDYAKSLSERQNEEIRSVKDQLKQKMKDGKRPTKTEMESMINLLERADNDRSNLDFIAEQTEEVFEAAVREARQQIDEHVSRTGIAQSPIHNLQGPSSETIKRIREYKSFLCCEHANETPAVCPCDSDCYCKSQNCKDS